MLKKKSKNGEDFYYIKQCHHLSNYGEDYVTFNVFRYEFHNGDDEHENTMYDLEQMFNTEDEAKKYAKFLEENHYKEQTKTFSLYETKMHKASEILDILKELDKKLVYFKFIDDPYKADYVISYGGDGTLLDAFNVFPNKIIIPIRDYSRCDIHNDICKYFFSKNIENYDILNIKSSNENINVQGISEFVLRNADMTRAIRFDLYINDKPYALNSIGDGLIISTSLGSTGYFKNITNVFFTDCIGIGFLNNAQRMSNLIIPKSSKIKIVLNRGDCEWSIDHEIYKSTQGNEFEISIDEKNSFKLFGYKNNFMCKECRDKRHSGYVNTIFNVIK